MTKPKVKVVGSLSKPYLLEHLLRQTMEAKEEGYLYDAIESARLWVDEHVTDTDTHSGSAQTATIDAVSICKFFKEGKCRFGEKCFNKHPGFQNESITEALGNGTVQLLNNEGNERINEFPMGKDETVTLLKDKSENSSDKEHNSSEKKQPMKTAIDVISRILWDDSLPTEKFSVGYLDRFIGIVEKPFSSFSWEDIASVDFTTLAIPKHRIQYFKCNDVIVWDKRNRLDNVFGSTGSKKKIHDVIYNYRDDKESYSTDTTQDQIDVEDDSEVSEGEFEDSGNAKKTCNVERKKWKEKDRPNFFFCFKVTDNAIRKKILEIQEDIIGCNDLFEEGCLKDSEMHVTLCMLRLNDDKEKQRALTVLESMQPILVCMLPSLHKLTFETLGNFRGRVLHVGVSADSELSKFVNVLLMKLKDAGLQTCGNREPYCPHVTILKLSRPMCRTLCSTQINPTYYMRHNKTHFGKQAIEKLYLCSTSKRRNEDGFYIEEGWKANSLLCVSDKLPTAIAKYVNYLVKESVLSEGEGDDLLEDLLSNDDDKFESSARKINALLDKNNIKPCDQRIVIVMRGLQGSGKSHIAEKICSQMEMKKENNNGNKFIVCSADDYYENSPSGYTFNPSNLANAHAFCRNKFIDAVCNDVSVIIIDNTNSQCWEYQIYKRIADLCNYSTYVVEIPCRNEDTLKKFMVRSQHKVDNEAVHRMWNRWETDESAIVIRPDFGDEADDFSLLEMFKIERQSGIDAKEVLFSGFFLDATSKSLLLSEFPPKHNRVNANHMTLVYKPMLETLHHIPVGKDHSVTVIGFVSTDLMQAVALKENGETLCGLEIAHVTISHSRKAAPQHSKLALANKTAWEQPKRELILTGKIGVQVAVSEKTSVTVTDAVMYEGVLKNLSTRTLKNNEIALTGGNKKKRQPEYASAARKVETVPSLSIGPQKITSLFVFDFDGTLFQTPDPVKGRKQYEVLVGEKWPHKGWIGKQESLQWPLHSYPGPSYVDFKEHIGRAGTLAVLLTGRLQRTLAGVNEVLQEYGIHPEKFFLKPDTHSNDSSKAVVQVSSYKNDVVRNLLKENPHVRTVKIWDDRQDNIDAFRKLKREHRDVNFELFKVGYDDFKQKKATKNGFSSDDVTRMIKDFGFGYSPIFDSAAQEGVNFVIDAWATILGLTEDRTHNFVKPFGSFPLQRMGDVDMCLLAPAYLKQDECVVKLEAEFLKRGVRHIHAATGIRCPRLKIRLHFQNTAPVDFDIVFAPCLPTIEDPIIDIPEVFQNGGKDVKVTLEGVLFVKKVQECINGRIDIEDFGKIIDLVVFYLKTKHLKGNAFHCLRTFHIVRPLAEMFSKIPKTNTDSQDFANLLQRSFEHLASLDVEYWKRICKDSVPEETINMSMESFIDAVKAINQSEQLSSLFAVTMFPPANHTEISVTVRSHISEVQWRASTILEAKIGPCVRKLLATGVNVLPGPSDYNNTIRFAVNKNERNLQVCQNILRGLKGEFLDARDNLEITIKIADD